jgi:hypothetical protein
MRREEKERDREKASLLRGEARASGAGELLCGLTSCSGRESEGGCSGCSTESEGSGEGSGLSSRAGEGYLLPISGSTEAEAYGAGEQSEGRSESTNRAKHEKRSEGRGGDRSPHARDNRKEGEGGQSLPAVLSQLFTISEELLEI